jgi:hypothetical protein
MDTQQAKRIVALRDKVLSDRDQHLKLAIAAKDTDPQKASYHTGLADGRNHVARELDAILNNTETVWVSR